MWELPSLALIRLSLVLVLDLDLVPPYNPTRLLESTTDSAQHVRRVARFVMKEGTHPHLPIAFLTKEEPSPSFFS